MLYYQCSIMLLFYGYLKMDASMDDSQKSICDDMKYGQFSVIVALQI